MIYAYGKSKTIVCPKDYQKLNVVYKDYTNVIYSIPIFFLPSFIGHHISSNNSSKDGPPSFRVRVCRRCRQATEHIELGTFSIEFELIKLLFHCIGTYVDQESALLVNDFHEILEGRFFCLQLLVEKDRAYISRFRVRKLHKTRVETYPIEEILSEKLRDHSIKIGRSKSKMEGGSDGQSVISAYKIHQHKFHYYDR